MEGNVPFSNRKEMFAVDKKAFQIFVKQFRKEGDKYPRAMMYGSQIRRRQATINCGHNSKSEKIVQNIINSGLDKFLESQNARYKVERKLSEREDIISQIRIYY